jgi:hypothetical protein
MNLICARAALGILERRQGPHASRAHHLVEYHEGQFGPRFPDELQELSFQATRKDHRAIWNEGRGRVQPEIG